MKYIALTLLVLVAMIAIFYLSLASREPLPVLTAKTPATITAQQNLIPPMAPGTSANVAEKAGVRAMQREHTPREALSDFVTAIDAAEMDRVSASIKLDSESRSRIEALIAGLPEEARGRYVTAEDLVAMYYATAPIEAVEVMSERRLSNGDVVQSVRIRFRGERESHSDEMIFHMEGGRWRQIVPSRHVERILDHVKERRKAQPVASNGLY